MQALMKAQDPDAVRIGLFHFEAIPRTVELQQVVGCEVIRHTAGVRNRGEADAAGCKVGLNRSVPAGNIEEQAGHSSAFVFFKCCRQNGSSFSRDQLHASPVAQQKKLERMRRKMCLLDSIGGGASGGFGNDVPAKWKKGRLPIVAQPGAQLMSAAKTLDTPNARLKHPGSVFVRLQGPVRH